ncbi:DMT family transporter [Alteromonas gracilis]|uniref:DMT family transporter n=1 Tax=Alteromonas gracilis TaxID=1479524 RepID=UPI0030D27CA6
MSNYIKLWVMGCFLAVSVILAKLLMQFGIHPIHLAMLQSIGSAIFIAAFGLRGALKSLKANMSYYIWASLLGFTVPQLVVFYSVEHVGVGVVSLAYAFPLILTYFLSSAFSKVKMQAKPVFFLFCAFSGSLLFLYKPDVINISQEHLIWLLLLSTAPLVISFANIYRSSYWPQNVPTHHVALLTNVMSFLSYGLFAVFKSPELPELSEIELAHYTSIFALMIIASIGQYLLFSLQKVSTPAFVGQTGSITAFCGGILGFLIFGESYQVSTLIGSMLILFGVAKFSQYQIGQQSIVERNS